MYIHLIVHVASYIHTYTYTCIAALYSYTCGPAQTHTNAYACTHITHVQWNLHVYYGYPGTNQKCFNSQRIKGVLVFHVNLYVRAPLRTITS